MIDTDEIVAEIRRRVAQRRDEGKYPIGLEEQLDAEFNAILAVVHRGSQELHEIGRLLDELDASIKRLAQRKGRRKSKLDGDVLLEVLQTQSRILKVQSNALERLRHGDLESLSQLNQLMRERLMMIDPIAEAVVNLESQMRRGHTE